MLVKFSKHKSLRIAVLSFLTLCFFGAAFVTAVLTVQPKQAEALCCESCCVCIISTFFHDTGQWIQSWFKLNLHFYINLLIHQYTWMDWWFFQGNLLPLFTQMGVQLSSVGMQQVAIIGMFFDAREQLERQRLLQEMHRRAHKDYHPSLGMCEFGTRVKSLAASERKGEMNALILSERSTDRLLGAKDTASAFGPGDDISVRFGEYITKHCDSFDNERSLSIVCTALDPADDLTPEQRNMLNLDIDYQRAVENPWTIGFDLTDDSGIATDNDNLVYSIANNLYGYDTLARVNEKKIKNRTNAALTDLQQSYLNLRSVAAKAKVAENSFNALMALKGEGTAGSREFLVSYLEELGMPIEEVDELIGENPSYYAQMEILTKKAYQSQMFYTNLYDKPVNVERKGVALQAISLMQKFDLFKSYLRTEASLSVLLELSLQQLQREIDDNIQSYTSKSKG